MLDGEKLAMGYLYEAMDRAKENKGEVGFTSELRYGM